METERFTGTCCKAAKWIYLGNTYQMEIIQGMRDEIAVLKGNKPKPMIKPSGMEDGDKKDSDKKPSDEKRPGSEKREKTGELPPQVKGHFDPSLISYTLNG